MYKKAPRCNDCKRKMEFKAVASDGLMFQCTNKECLGIFFVDGIELLDD